MILDKFDNYEAAGNQLFSDYFSVADEETFGVSLILCSDGKHTMNFTVDENDNTVGILSVRDSNGSLVAFSKTSVGEDIGRDFEEFITDFFSLRSNDDEHGDVDLH